MNKWCRNGLRLRSLRPALLQVQVYAAVSGSKVEQPSSTPVPGSPSGAPNSNADSLVESGKDYSGVQQAGTSLHGDAPGPTGEDSWYF